MKVCGSVEVIGHPLWIPHLPLTYSPAKTVHVYCPVSLADTWLSSRHQSQNDSLHLGARSALECSLSTQYSLDSLWKWTVTKDVAAAVHIMLDAHSLAFLLSSSSSKSIASLQQQGPQVRQADHLHAELRLADTSCAENPIKLCPSRTGLYSDSAEECP